MAYGWPVVSHAVDRILCIWPDFKIDGLDHDPIFSSVFSTITQTKKKHAQMTTINRIFQWQNQAMLAATQMKIKKPGQQK